MSLRKDIRRAILNVKSFAKLKKQIEEIYKVEEGTELKVCYTDDEGDMVTITSDKELEYALQFIDKGLLRLNIFKVVSKEKEVVEDRKTGENKLESVASQQPNPRPHHPHSHPHHPHHHGRHHHCRQGERWKEGGEEKREGWREGWEERKEMREEKRKNKLVSKFVEHVNLPPDSIVAPGEKMDKKWLIKNGGEIGWPEGCHLVMITKSSSIEVPVKSVPVEALAPGEEVVVSLPLVAPNAPDHYYCYFKMEAPSGKRFGQRIWVSLTVKEPAQSK